tara:strand:+ start:194 stop:607 length:414 start_codon:yes stop_codon:yes gene_type:complete
MFFKKKEKVNIDTNLIKICALLIHAAKIDEHFSKKEEKIIKQTMLKIGVKNDYLDKLFSEAVKIEDNSNQILNFTKEVKNMRDENKIQIIEALWRIIYSNKEADIYETSLMRRLGGLLYVDNKVMGDIKDKIKNENL